MKNLTYMPFSRNRYFYGKLLTAEDFEQEQRYSNDKRRMINRFVFGAGIVAGLEVIRVDDYNISLEMGLALDETGREIVVDKPVIKKLSQLEGFEEATKEEGAESLYLCIEYCESPIEPVQNIANPSVHVSEETEYNKYQEHYRLYVTDDEPEMVEAMEPGQDPLRFIYDRAERIRRNTYQQGIWLAKIRLVKAGPFYMIDQIEPVPFHQLVAGQVQMEGSIEELRQEVFELRRQGVKKEDTVKADSADMNLETEWQMAEGTIHIHIGKNGRQGRSFFSEPVPHGLGLGNVQILLRVNQGEASYSGAEGIFDDYDQKVAAASRLNRSDGTFVVGIRILDDLKDADVLIGWTAIRNRKRNEFRREEKRLFIKPGMVNIRVREDVSLSVIGVNMTDTAVIWTVKSPGGGSIDKDGTYHAPNEPGVYEVNAESIHDPEVRAAVYIVVRE